jgi:hypothetical protein
VVFASSVIRKLAPSEEWYAQSKTWSSITLCLSGPFDTDAMSVAFDALLQSHPVLAGHLETGSDGRHQIVVDDLLHPGIRTAGDFDRGSAETRGIRLDPNESVLNLMVGSSEGRTQLTLCAHHSLADGYHLAGLLLELFARYTDVVCTGGAGPVSVQPAPESLEAVLQHRGITKQPRSGLERFLPAMFAFELPPPRAQGPVSEHGAPVAVPVARGRLTERETTVLVEYGQAHGLFLNPLVSAAILLAEWRLRKTPDIPIPYVYVVDLRSILEPPVPAMGATNPLGMATYLATIKPVTKLVDLARDVAEAFRVDLSDGVIQQSMLHFKPQYDDTQRGLPDVVSSTNLGRTPVLRTPPMLHVDDWHTDIYRPSAIFDMYSVGIFAEQLAVERHTYARQSQRSVDLVLSLLRAAATEFGGDNG